jgi:hypothetical protein
LPANFPQLFHDVSVPKGTNGKEQKAGVGDGVCEDNTNCVQALWRLVVDVTADASNVILAEIGIPKTRV